MKTCVLLAFLAIAGPQLAHAQTQRHICRLLKPAEIEPLIGVPVVLGNVVEEEADRATCQYEDANGAARFILSAHWTGGKAKWEAARAELASDAKPPPGPVTGLGDGAWFSAQTPSLVLKGDILLVLSMNMLKNPQVRFRPLVEALLPRL